MRKEYVKPVMESEAFVSNEYVAACWTLTCTGTCGGVETTRDEGYSEGVFFEYGEFANEEPCTNKIDETIVKVDSFRDLLKLVGDALSGEISEREFWEYLWLGRPITTTTRFHPIKVTKGWENHPNAS